MPDELVITVAPHPEGGWQMVAMGRINHRERYRTKAEARHAAYREAEQAGTSRVVIKRRDGVVKSDRRLTEEHFW